MMKKYRYIFLIVAILFNGYLVYQSTLPGEKSSHNSVDVTNVVVDIVGEVPPLKDAFLDSLSFNQIHLLVRKLIGHFGAFMLSGILSFISVLLFVPNHYLRFGITFLNGIVLSMGTEWIQLHVKNRYGSIKDVGINLLGYVGMIFLIYLIMLGYNFKKKKRGNYEKRNI